MVSYTKKICLGEKEIGGNAPVTVQAMTKCSTRDFDSLVQEIRDLEAVGADIIRIAVPDEVCVRSIEKVLSSTTLPIVADVHFHYELAIKAIEAGVHGIRINPGNIRSDAKVCEITDCARRNGTVIRVGINGGSLEPSFRERDGGVTPRGLVDSALLHCNTIENQGHDQLKVSIKASDLDTMVTANRLFADESSIPLHLGVTEAGPKDIGTVKSAIGIGSLLLDGIGDTLRVSLSSDSLAEIKAGRDILRSLSLVPGLPDIVSCPTCARKNFDVVSVATEVEDEIQRLFQGGYQFTFSKVAVMGCAVNGPGEARHADIGIAGAPDATVLFKKGQVVEKLSNASATEALLQEVRANAEAP